MLIVFCLFYIATLIATGYATWISFRSGLYKFKWLILALFFIYHFAIYYFESHSTVLLILAITYGFILFEIVFYISKQVVETFHNKKID